jgi:hypothetical protein
MRIVGIITALALVGTLAACGQQQGDKAATPEAVVAAGPTPADFEPCNTVTFDAIEAVIGSRPTISVDDRTGQVSPGWSICNFARRDGSPGPTYAVRIAKFDSSAAAASRHTEIVNGLAGAQPISGDADGAVVWVEGNVLNLQYQKGWWLTRRSIEGATDAAARARLLATPRWP